MAIYIVVHLRPAFGDLIVSLLRAHGCAATMRKVVKRIEVHETKVDGL
jgi:hypothetical protein